MIDKEEIIDAIILAGTGGSEPLDTITGRDHKQYLELGSQAVTKYPVDAARECPRINQIYIPCDIERMTDALGGIPDDTTLIPDQGTIISNLRIAFEQYVLNDSFGRPFLSDRQTRSEYLSSVDIGPMDKRVVVLFSDNPFITADDITRFIETSDELVVDHPSFESRKDKRPDYVVGFAHDEAISNIEDQVSVALCTPEFKTALFPFDSTMVRTNNMFYGKLLTIPQNVWDLPQRVYDNRKLLDRKGRDKSNNWRNLVSTFGSYAWNSSDRSAVFSGFLRGMIHFGAFWHSHQTKNPLPRLFVAKQDFERVAYDLTGREAYGMINLTDVVHPMFDIDNAEMFDFLKAGDEEMFERIRHTTHPYAYSDNGSFRATEALTPSNGVEIKYTA